MLTLPESGQTGAARWLRLWPAGLSGVLLCCCGAYLVPSAVTGGFTRALTTVLVLGVFLALVVADRALLPRPANESPSRPAAFGWRALAVATMVALPWKPAAFLFAPRNRLAPEDAVVRLLGRIRVVLGVVIVVGVAIWYRDYDGLELEALLRNWTTTGLLAIPSCLICMGLLAAVTRAPLRRAAIGQMRWPALSLLAFAGTIVLLILFSEGAGYVSGRLGTALPLDNFVYGGVLGLWLLVFIFRGAYLVTQNWFNAVDGHLLLPPLIATWMAWLVAGSSVIFDAGTGGTPTGVSRILIIGGAAATTGIAAVESWRTARLHGVTPRGGPWPSTRPAHEASSATKGLIT